MIRFESIRVQNFALYPDVTIPFSIDKEHPLTLLRGANESGKTTLMRAFVWVLFGNISLPSISNTRHPVRPVWSKVGEEIKTRVTVRFRFESERGSSSFRLSRSLNTTDDGKVVSSNEETVVLFKRDGDDWIEQADELQLLLKQLFRPEMSDFYFIDADKAVEFVGGPEGRHSDQLMRKAATQSIRALLGLDVMLRTRERLEERHLHWSRQTGSQSANVDQQRLAKELEDIQKDLDNKKKELSDCIVKEKDIDEAYRAIENDFEDKLSKLEELNETNEKYDKVSQELSLAKSRQSELVNELVQRLDDERLFAGIMIPIIDSVMNNLQPLKEKGYLPPKELTLLPRLLDRGVCVCGINLKDNPSHRRHIEEQIKNAEQTRDRSHFLDSALEDARSLGNRALERSGIGWVSDTESTAKELSNLDLRISQLVDQYDALREIREKHGSGFAIKELKKHRDELQSQLDEIRNLRMGFETDVDRLQSSARSLSERIRSAATAEERTQLASSCAEVSDQLRQIISIAYDSIEREQVVDVSHSMNDIFRDVISATTDSLFEEVGIKAAKTSSPGMQYEVYAMEGGREKPLALANGASRRAIGVAFVLALSKETGTKVPLVADSLLHALSGSVKSKIVEYLTSGYGVGQPILFGTRSDFLDPDVSEILKERAGKTYTLTSQAHAGGDVVRATPGAFTKQVVICNCNLDEYCPVCEREGDKIRAKENRMHPKTDSQVLN